MSSEKETPSTLFIHGRPCAHPCHSFFAQSIHAQFIPEDYYVHWLDNPNSSHPKRYFSWLINALFLPGTLRNKIYFTECIRFPLYFRKKWGLAARKKLIVLVDDETPYFLYNNLYSKRTARYLTKFLNYADGIITIGNMQKHYLQSVLPHYKGNIAICYNPILHNRFEKLNTIQIDITSKRILVIANGPTQIRMFYKGLDLMVKAFEQIYDSHPAYELCIAGVWYPEIIEELRKMVSTQVSSHIRFLGELPNIDDEIKKSGLCWHLSRGEAWGVSVTECMLAGLPVIVSNITGSAEMLHQKNDWMKINCESEILAETTLKYLNLSPEEKSEISALNKLSAQSLTQEKCSIDFIQKFNQLANS